MGGQVMLASARRWRARTCTSRVNSGGKCLRVCECGDAPLSHGHRRGKVIDKQKRKAYKQQVTRLACIRYFNKRRELWQFPARRATGCAFEKCLETLYCGTLIAKAKCV